MPSSVPVKPLKPWFQTLDDVGPVLNWETFFGNNQPVELDIGSGRGLFLFNASIRNPGTNFVGLEIDYGEGRRAATRLMKRDLANARVIGGDANLALTQVIAPGPAIFLPTSHRNIRQFPLQPAKAIAHMVNRLVVNGKARSKG